MELGKQSANKMTISTTLQKEKIRKEKNTSQQSVTYQYLVMFVLRVHW
jgi:hypothetical protein